MAGIGELLGIRSEIPITDQEVRGILGEFGKVLHDGIKQNPGRPFIYRSSGNDFERASVMGNKERELWEKEHGVEEAMKKEVRAGNLYTPDMSSAFPESEIDHKINGLPPLPEKPRYRDVDESEDDFKKREYEYQEAKAAHDELYSRGLIELPKGPRMAARLHKVTEFDQKRMDFYTVPFIHLGGGVSNKEGLYNAFVSFKAYAADQNGNWVVHYGEPLGSRSYKLSRYAPKAFGETDMWFNTVVDPSKENGIKINNDQRTFSVALHNLELIDDLQIPQNSHLRFFFWQWKQSIPELPQLDQRNFNT